MALPHPTEPLPGWPVEPDYVAPTYLPAQLLQHPPAVPTVMVPTAAPASRGILMYTSPPQPPLPVTRADPWPMRLVGMGVLLAGGGIGIYFAGLGIKAAGGGLAVAAVLAALAWLRHGGLGGSGRGAVNVKVRIDNRN